jgi:anti-sigma factor RsiW
MRCDECRDALGAHVDGELLPEESESIRGHLASCDQCASEHEALMTLSRRLREGLERSPAPDVLEARIRSALARPDGFEPLVRPGRLPWTGLISAGLLVAALSSGASFAVARRGASAPSIGDQVLSSHIRSLMPGHLTDVASSDQHNVKPWFNGRVDMSPAVPRLDSAGFPLVGGRLDYVGGRPVAAVVYMRRQHVVNLFSWPVEDRAAQGATLSTEKGYHLLHWRSDGSEFWAASDVGRRDLEQFVALFARAASDTGTR